MVYNVAITLHKTRWESSYPFLTYALVNLRCMQAGCFMHQDEY